MNGFFQNNLTYAFLFLIIFLIILSVWNFYILLKIKEIKKVGKEIFSGKNGEDLEKIILRWIEQGQKNKNDIKELFDAYEKIYKITTKAVQKIGVIRYNPFGDIGGNQSFVIAFLDKDNSGVIISSLYTREGVRFFAKSISNNKCLDFPLTEEEKSAIKNATTSKKSLYV